MKAFSVSKIENIQEYPFVLDSPHSGTIYPDDFNYAVKLEILRQAEDTYVDQLIEELASRGLPTLCANFPRTYIDVNRSLNEVDLELIADSWPSPVIPSSKTRLGKGLVWRQLDTGDEIYSSRLLTKEIEYRIDNYWIPYHNELKRLLQTVYDTHGYVVHFNCHSMPSVSGPLSTEEPGLIHPDFVLGDRDGTSANPLITQFIYKFLTGLGYNCWINRPYKGVELVRAYSNPSQRRHSIQVEINRKLYMNEQTLELHSGFEKIRSDLNALVMETISFCRQTASFLYTSTR
jgi:N-formylglutamate deformylase